MRALATASCAPAKPPTPANPTAKPERKPGLAGNHCSRLRISSIDEMTGEVLVLVGGLHVLHRLRTKAALHGLCWHIRMGVSKLEAWLLSSQAALRQIPESLRHAPEHGRSELHLPPLSNGEVAARLD